MPARRYSNGAINSALQLTGACELTAKAAEAARLLTLLANEHRLAILCEMIGGERSVGSLVAAVGLTQSALALDGVLAAALRSEIGDGDSAERLT
jgi:hypothetical protein